MPFGIFAVGVALIILSISGAGGTGFAAILLVAAFLGVSLLPGIVASARGHHNRLAIWVLTCLMIPITGTSAAVPLNQGMFLSHALVLVGVGFIGWLVALIWACTAVRRATAFGLSAAH